MESCCQLGRQNNIKISLKTRLLIFCPTNEIDNHLNIQIDIHKCALLWNYNMKYRLGHQDKVLIQLAVCNTSFVQKMNMDGFLDNNLKQNHTLLP